MAWQGSVPYIVKIAINLFYGGLEEGSHQEVRICGHPPPYGGLEEGSHQEADGEFDGLAARRLFERCVEMNPSRMVHRIELGRTYLKLNMRQEADEALSTGLAMERSRKQGPGLTGGHLTPRRRRDHTPFRPYIPRPAASLGGVPMLRRAPDVNAGLRLGSERGLRLGADGAVEDINALLDKYDGEQMLKSLRKGDRKVYTAWRTVPAAWLKEAVVEERRRKRKTSHAHFLS
eukprot:1175717-Prorocentrum_minimum.AAC.1